MTAKSSSQTDMELEYIELCRDKLEQLKVYTNSDIDVIQTTENIRFTIPLTSELLDVIEYILRQEYQRLLALKQEQMADKDLDDTEFVKNFWRDFG